MAIHYQVHPENPQQRKIRKVADAVRDDALLAYPTDSCFALGTRLGNKEGMDRIRRLRKLDEQHHFTLVCQDFAQLGQFVHVDNDIFRAVKAATPGSFTFILPATKEVPRRLLHPKKKTVGVRIPDHVTAQALVAELGEPLLSSTLILAGEDDPMTSGQDIADRIGSSLDVIVDSGDCGVDPTTVVDFSGDEPVIAREGAGDISWFV